MYETTDERAERLAEQDPGTQTSLKKEAKGWAFVAAAFGIFVVIPIALLFWIGSAIFGGDGSNDHQMTETEIDSAALYLTWDKMSPSDQIMLCQGWNTAPRSSYDTIAASWGSTVPPYETVSYFFRTVC